MKISTGLMFNSRLARCRAPSQPYQKKAAVEAQSSSGDISPVSWARLRPRAKTSCHSAKTAESCSRKFSGKVLTSCASFPARQPERQLVRAISSRTSPTKARRLPSGDRDVSERQRSSFCVMESL